jgi:hypothetical protein
VYLSDLGSVDHKYIDFSQEFFHLEIEKSFLSKVYLFIT